MPAAATMLGLQSAALATLAVLAPLSQAAYSLTTAHEGTDFVSSLLKPNWIQFELRLISKLGLRAVRRMDFLRLVRCKWTKA